LYVCDTAALKLYCYMFLQIPIVCCDGHFNLRCSLENFNKTYWKFAHFSM